VDHLFLKNAKYGIPPGKTLRVIHDPMLFDPIDPVRVSIGDIRTLWALNTSGLQVVGK
jgi:hypothetical protein